MNLKRIVFFGLLCGVILVSLYAIFVLDVTQLFRINQALGVELSWYSFHEYLVRELPGMLRSEVHSLFEKIGMRAVIHPQGSCEYVQLGNLLKITTYSFCYDQTDRLTILVLSS